MFPDIQLSVLNSLSITWLEFQSYITPGTIQGKHIDYSMNLILDINGAVINCRKYRLDDFQYKIARIRRISK